MPPTPWIVGGFVTERTTSAATPVSQYDDATATPLSAVQSKAHAGVVSYPFRMSARLYREVDSANTRLPSTGSTAKKPLISAAADVTTSMIICRPSAVTRSSAMHLPQQSYEFHSFGPRSHVSLPSAGGSAPPSGRPRRNHAPTLKHALYAGAVASSSDAKSSARRMGLVFAGVSASRRRRCEYFAGWWSEVSSGVKRWW